MSRSYKKTPYCGDHKGKLKKRLANHKLRQRLKNFDEEYQHMSYKNVTNRWDICDYYDIIDWQEWWELHLKRHYEAVNGIRHYCSSSNDILPPNKKELYRKWYKYYKRK
jgi:hypothetical protein